MREGTRKGLMTMAAATGVIAAATGYAHADSGARGAAGDSPGVLSGNTVQAPVHAPVNICGNTVNVVGLLNPSVGNKCAHYGGTSGSRPGGPAGSGSGGSRADGHTGGSPGVGSGNTVQVPVDVPVNVCGNSVDVIGVGNATTGNRCADDGGTATRPRSREGRGSRAARGIRGSQGSRGSPGSRVTQGSRASRGSRVTPAGRAIPVSPATPATPVPAPRRPSTVPAPAAGPRPRRRRAAPAGRRPSVSSRTPAVTCRSASRCRPARARCSPVRSSTAGPGPRDDRAPVTGTGPPHRGDRDRVTPR